MAKAPKPSPEQNLQEETPQKSNEQLEEESPDLKQLGPPPTAKTLGLDPRDFESFTDFVYTYFDKAKQFDKNWKQGTFAKVLGMKASNLAAMKNKFTKLNNEIISAFYQILDLGKDQTAYFDILLQLYHLEQDAALVLLPGGVNNLTNLYKNQKELVEIVQKFSGKRFKNRQDFLDKLRSDLKGYWNFSLEDNLMAGIQLVNPKVQYFFDKNFADYKTKRGEYVKKTIDQAQSKCLTTSLDFFVWMYIRYHSGCTLIEIYQNLKTELTFTEKNIEQAIRELGQAHLIRERDLKYYHEEALPSVRISQDQIRRFNRELSEVQQQLISIPQDEKLVAFNLIAIPQGRLQELRTRLLPAYDSIIKDFKVVEEDVEYILLTNLSFFSILKSEEEGK